MIHCDSSRAIEKVDKKGESFIFGPQQQVVAFTDLKIRLAQVDILGYFDRTAKTKDITDVSPVGLGAVLVREQKGKNHVISYASRGLSDIEQRYSQTNKEALGIVWACERFHAYGVDFELQTSGIHLLSSL